VPPPAAELCLAQVLELLLLLSELLLLLML
jgi:hypothetical protein